jgi:L,D-transpeptidase ErfK/SrfK
MRPALSTHFRVATAPENWHYSELFMRTLRALPFLMLLLPFPAMADMLVGGDISYPTRKGDCLVLIGARVGVDWEIIARGNRIEPKNQCKIGTQLAITNRKIVPKVVENGIVVNIPDRMLYFFKDGRLVKFFPVGLGNREWQTPVGRFVILGKQQNPTWHVPKSIQGEMAKKGEPVKEIVPPGPDNPLGRFALSTSLPGILIHETIWPTTIYQWRSHGCIRVLPEDMESGFYDMVGKGTLGEIIYQPASVAVSEGGRIFLQVDRDIYRMIKSMEDAARGEIEKRGLTGKVDWIKVKSVVKQRTGVAEDITLASTGSAS